MVNFLTESASDFKETATVGGFNYGSHKQSFDDIFTEAYNNLLTEGINVMLDISEMVKRKPIMESFKDTLLQGLETQIKEAVDEEKELGSHAYLYEQVSQMFDNCLEDFYTESQRVPNLLPIKAVDFPILIKQNLKLASKDILQTEVTKTPIVKKHIEQTYVVDKKSKKRWKYPQCFFTDEFKEVYKAGKGLPINTTKVKLPIHDYDIISNLTEGDVNVDNITMDIRIESVFVGDTEVVLDPPMRVNTSDNTWLGGRIKKTVTTGSGTVEVDDVVTGLIDFTNNTTSINSATGQVTHVVFSGYLSNERNERDITFDYVREEREWKIEDGMRADVPYSLEELEDAKALMDIDLYKKTYNNLSDILVQMEDSLSLDWLDEQFDKYNGVEVEDVLGWSSFITNAQFDCDSTGLTTALPSEYIADMLKFKIDGIIIDMCDRAKLEDMTFVVYGNPRIVRLLDPKVKWIVRPGSSYNGVKLDYSYGVMTSGDVKVQVVSTKKVNHKYTDGVYRGLRLIPYPLSQEQMTFKHYKYTSHILTSQNSAYRDSTLPGGSMTYLMGTSRYTNAAVQGIQGQVDIINAEPYISLV